MGMFKNTLLLAQQGNEKAMEKLLNRYDPLLKKCSIIQGHFDEDLYQSLILEFVRAVFTHTCFAIPLSACSCRILTSVLQRLPLKQVTPSRARL